jgi:hypothetical protein
MVDLFLKPRAALDKQTVAAHRSRTRVRGVGNLASRRLMPWREFELALAFRMICGHHQPGHFLQMTDRELRLKSVRRREKMLEADFGWRAHHPGKIEN